MKKLAYMVLLRKYFLIDLGVLLLLIVLPIYNDPQGAKEIFLRAFFYSGFITPIISYTEIKRSHQLPFFDNLNLSQLTFYILLLLFKTGISLSVVLYV